MAEASEWVRRWRHWIQPGYRVLDIACGSGRHMRWFAEQGCHVTGIDRNKESLNSASAFGTTVLADIENGPWPLMEAELPLRFDVVVVTDYLWRPIFQRVLDSVAPGGLLLYETFAQGNETVGKPSRPDFLLVTGELLQRCLGMHVAAYEDGFLERPERFVQRIAAFRLPVEPVAAAAVARRLLSLKYPANSSLVP